MLGAHICTLGLTLLVACINKPGPTLHEAHIEGNLFLMSFLQKHWFLQERCVALLPCLVNHTVSLGFVAADCLWLRVSSKLHNRRGSCVIVNKRR